jgi:hypothetical protein
VFDSSASIQCGGGRCLTSIGRLARPQLDQIWRSGFCREIGLGPHLD